MHATKPQIEWDTLDIPKGAQYYQPKGAVNFKGDIVNEARFFRKNFTEVVVPIVKPNWVKASRLTNWAGSIKIPEQYLVSNRVLKIDGKEIYVPLAAAYFQKANSTDAGNPLRFFRNDFKEVFVPEVSLIWLATEEGTDYTSAIDITEMRHVSIQQQLQESQQIASQKQQLPEKHSHYFRDVSKLDKVDFYMLCRLFNVTDPCLQHIFKKVIATGNRGHKNYQQDIQDIFDTAKRLLEIEEELK